MICQLNSSVASNLGPVRLCVGWGRAGNTKSGPLNSGLGIILAGGFKYVFYFHSYLGKIPILTNIFQRGGSTTNWYTNLARFPWTGTYTKPMDLSWDSTDSTKELKSQPPSKAGGGKQLSTAPNPRENPWKTRGNFATGFQ